jgi:hypothetical protein
VTLANQPHRYGDRLLAAPVAGRRAACAALIAAIGESVLRAKLLPGFTAGFVVEQGLSQRGLATLAHTAGPFDETIVLDARPGSRGGLSQTPEPDTGSRIPGLGQVVLWSIPVRYSGTAVETVALPDADSLRSKLVRWIGGER